MKTGKTFRLFISSTFNDFREERKLLQTEIFPEIKKYCSEKGYSFQPIDLRWGINEEAQLDQKTLELCLEEVRACKAYPHPNFLVMLGDRYGWVPLPYAIEKDEFNEILNYVDDKDILLEWYQLDENQLPASYILKYREGIYTDMNIWSKKENELLTTLQKAVNKTALTDEQKRKYFTSATEAEIEEGILSYLKPTNFQKKLLLEYPDLIKNDTEHIFGFFRNIEKKGIVSDKFISNDYNKAQELKSKVKSILLKENIYECNTIQKNTENLDYSYLDVLKKRIVKFLKDKIDCQIAKEIQYSELEIEKQEQAYFAKQKRKNFVGQEAISKKISDYISNNNRQPFVLYGKSGSGKTSIMAKAIENAQQNTNAKIIYRFVGATPNSSSSYSLLTSIFEELNIGIEKIKNENFSDFFELIKNKFIKIKDNVVIFIDAVDQLTNDDSFFWLPEKLPKNVKIIISALNDFNYKEDSRYFEQLKEISTNIHQIKQFNQAEKLLINLLKVENRTIQEHQLRYFLKQYNNIRTPLYIHVAAQEIKYWKSFDLVEGQKTTKNQKIQDLSNSQKGIIGEYINNLSEIYHHDKKLVQRVLGYIYMSKDGLTEGEILELINIDKEFIEKIAPNTWHTNLSHTLPMSIWIRLYSQIKPLLIIRKQDDYELLHFFHREFIDVISKKIDTTTFQLYLHSLQQTILEYQKNNNNNDHFDDKRWGKLYLELLKTSLKNVEDKDIDSVVIKQIDFLANLKNEIWIFELYRFLYNKVLDDNFRDGILNNDVVLNAKLSYLIAKTVYNKPIKYKFEKKDNLMIITADIPFKPIQIDLSSIGIDFDRAKEIFLNELPSKREDVWLQFLLKSTNYYAQILRKSGKFTESIKLLLESLEISRHFYEIEQKNERLKAWNDSKTGWAFQYTKDLIELGLAYEEKGDFKKALSLLEESLKLSKLKLKENKDSQVWRGQYIATLYSMGFLFLSLKDYKSAIYYGEKTVNEIIILYKDNILNINVTRFN